MKIQFYFSGDLFEIQILHLSKPVNLLNKLSKTNVYQEIKKAC